MIDILKNALTANGYREVSITGDDPGIDIYIDQTKSLINAVFFVPAEKYKEDLVTAFKNSFKNKMGELSMNVHFFIVLLVNSVSESFYEEMAISRQVCDMNAFSWIYDEAKEQLIIFENQAEDFYGLKRVLSNASEYKWDENENVQKKKNTKEELLAGIKRIPLATSLLVLVNILVFILCTFTGSLLYNKGGVGLKLINSPIDIYRIFSSMFLHADSAHIFSNMVLLYFLGDIVEKKIGAVRFLVLYFISGIWGCILTFISEMITGNYIVVIGASGAVFGILGALLALVIFKKISGRTLQVGRVFVVVLFSLYEGFTQANVANWAHVGGVLAGFFIGVIYSLLNSEKKGNGNED